MPAHPMRTVRLVAQPQHSHPRLLPIDGYILESKVAICKANIAGIRQDSLGKISSLNPRGPGFCRVAVAPAQSLNGVDSAFFRSTGTW